MSAMKRVVWFVVLMLLPASAALAQATLTGVVGIRRARRLRRDRRSVEFGAD
jgi:hypothetical protein